MSIFGEYETGKIIRLNLEDGSEETVLSGSSPFGGSNLYTPGDVVLMSMSGLNTFTALVKSGQDDGFHFLVCQDGNGHVISAFRYGIPAMILEILRQWAVYAAVILVIFGFAVVFTSAIRGGPYHYGTAVKCDDPASLHHHGAVWSSFLPVLQGRY